MARKKNDIPVGKDEIHLCPLGTYSLADHSDRSHVYGVKLINKIVKNAKTTTTTVTKKTDQTLIQVSLPLVHAPLIFILVPKQILLSLVEPLTNTSFCLLFSLIIISQTTFKMIREFFR